MVKSNLIYQILEADMVKENRNRFAEGRVNHAHVTIFWSLRFFFVFYKNGDNDFKKPSHEKLKEVTRRWIKVR